MTDRKHTDPFIWLAVSSSIIIIAFILFPLIEMVAQPSFADLMDTIKDKDVISSIWLSLYTSG
ncbi:MAG: hypothetical protein KAI50_13225, partial [Desulfobacterales bacterium]|nr:hypothetical protein [Desulfobacterales bacterium]